ncbi:MAG: hypothetical protein KDD64_15095 [Bdellovibrionales bacterium]|nr:hypothetical protein [Bdellovibrionales bacterium]
MSQPIPLQRDSWHWGTESIFWGFDPSHQYTLKLLQPKKGRDGCLSLQYHHEKSESWVVLEGVAWAFMIVDGQVCTRLLKKGDVQNLPTGIIHRLMGASDDVKILEPSTPDRHASDKSQPKDVVRLHCVFGRECAAARDSAEEALVERAIVVTEEAILQLERGELPQEIAPDLGGSLGAWNVYA